MANSSGSGGKSAARLKRRNETKMITRQPVMLISIIAVIVLLLLFVVYPLVKVLIFSLTDETGAFSLATAAEIFSTSRYLKTFGRTIVLGLIVAVIATFIGYVFAYAITRTNVPCKGFLKTIATLPILSPPFILCLSIIFLFGRQGLITNTLFGITDNNVYGMGSLIVVQVLSFFPIAYMTLSGILSSIDASVEDAACNMGASRWHTFWTVTFPLSLPGIISGCLLVFIQSLEDFSNPATIGGDFTTLSVEVYQTITGSYDMQKGSVLALLMLVPTMIAYLLNKYWVNKKSFVTVTGKPTQARKLIDEPHIKWPLFIFCMAVAAVIILFYGTVVFGSFVTTWGYNYTLTLDQYGRALQQGWDSLRNSIVLGLVAALIGGLLGMVIAYITAKRGLLRQAVHRGVLRSDVRGPRHSAGHRLHPGLQHAASGAHRHRRHPGDRVRVPEYARGHRVRHPPPCCRSTTPSRRRPRSWAPAARTPSADLPAHAAQRFFSGLVYSFVKAITAVSAIIFLVSPRWDLVTSRSTRSLTRRNTARPRPSSP